MSKRVIIIGAGVGGLAATVRLAAAGYRVTVLEKCERVGGKLNLWEVAHPDRPHDRPFRFDTGPSLLTLPFVFKDLFEAAGEDVRDHLTIDKLDPISRFVWADGEQFELRSDEQAMRKEIARFAPQDVEGWQRFAERGRRIWDLTGERFLSQTPERMLQGSESKWTESMKLATIPFRIGVFRRYASIVRQFIQHPRLRDVLYQYATYAGASPFLAPSTINVIAHCELEFGGWSIRGGMYQLAASLERIARKLGAEFRLGCAVTHLSTKPSERTRSHRHATRQVQSVTIETGEAIECDAVVCNADAPWAYQHLIDEADRSHFRNQRIARIDPGGSGMVLMLGVDGLYPQLAHHTKFMPVDYRGDLNAMFQRGAIPSDPCIYVCASTRTDPSIAPTGCENLFVLTSAPALNETIDWNTAGPAYEARVLDTLEKTFGLTDLRKRIVVKQRWTPSNLATRYNAYRGSIYGIGSNGIRSAFLRPANRDRKIAGLYLAGGATHPGGGLPLVAWSGKIAADLVQTDIPADG